MKRWISAALAALFLLLPGLPRAGAVELSAQCAVLMDAASGRLLYAQNPDAEKLIASTTKIMTALVVCEQCNVLDRVQIPQEAVGVEGSSMYLQAGEILTVQELLYGLMLHSGNDAAVALAIYCGGTVEGFVALMNDKARSLGLENTHFENPNGLDNENHYSSARDLAVLTAYAMENEIFAKTVSTRQIQVGGRQLTNHNKLLWRYDGADGVKTGYTKAAGRVLVSTAVRGGRRLVAVTINAPDDWNDHTKLLDYGFSQFAVKTLVSRDQMVGSLTVFSGQRETVDLIATQEFAWPMAQGEQVEVEIPGPGFVFAPVQAGQEAGFAHILVDGVGVGKVPLVYGETAELPPEPEKPGLFRRIFGGANA